MAFDRLNPRDSYSESVAGETGVCGDVWLVGPKVGGPPPSIM